MEIKKSNQYLNENKKLKDAQKELILQINEFDQMMEDKDLELQQLEDKCKELENELSKKRVQLKMKSYAKADQLLGNNPLT